MSAPHTPEQTAECSRRISEKTGNAKRALIEAINEAERAGLAGYSRTLSRLAGECERLQARIAKATGAAA